MNRDSHEEAAKGPISLADAMQHEHDWFAQRLPELLESRKATGAVLVEKLVEMLTGKCLEQRNDAALRAMDKEFIG